jgi:hypothetical protein
MNGTRHNTSPFDRLRMNGECQEVLDSLLYERNVVRESMSRGFET